MNRRVIDRYSADKEYGLVIDGIAKAVADFGDPLTERQRDVMAGTIASYLLKIEREGLDALLKNLAKRSLK